MIVDEAVQRVVVVNEKKGVVGGGTSFHFKTI